ncbi:transcription regulator (SlyA-related) [Ferroplasma acidiphilum]|uniref:Transcription regulator (SlyA-related) protein n=2 Tax=Ferroplasma TaxID=74968 RepID=S0AS57_FERAC|nr:MULTISPECIES: MarR family transcriptional regulator [Ferroplasma]AGO60839.1 transcription regulator (SlyA-related) protein [Ferroplasma acidarmanus Fer1]ARD85588.1 transcription regulator (SlyA-related) [Ferroplasma acidiphilum]
MDNALNIWSLFDSILGEYAVRIKSHLSSLSLSMVDYKILHLVHSEPKNMKYLADTLSLAKGWVTDITDGLEERNLVKRVHSSQDRRVINIEITDEGLKIYNKVGKMIKTIIGDSISSLPEDDVEKLSTILEKISQNMHCHS